MSWSDHRGFCYRFSNKNLPNDVSYMLLYYALLSTLLTELSIPICTAKKLQRTTKLCRKCTSGHKYLLKLILFWDALHSLYRFLHLFFLVSLVCGLHFRRQATRVTSPRQPVTSPLKAEESTCRVEGFPEIFMGHKYAWEAPWRLLLKCQTAKTAFKKY